MFTVPLIVEPYVQFVDIEKNLRHSYRERCLKTSQSYIIYIL